MSLDLSNLVKQALYCSILLAPRAPGLTLDEIKEVGKRLGFGAGEVGDAISYSLRAEEADRFFGSPKLFPKTDPWLCDFLTSSRPDYRNIAAFDFVINELAALSRQMGRESTKLGRDVLVERGKAASLPSNDLDVAITMMVLATHLTEKDGLVSLGAQWRTQTASAQAAQRDGFERQHNDLRAAIYPLVRDVIARRSDGRPASAEPLDAFLEQLPKLGFKAFQLWWRQTVDELKRLDPAVTPVSCLVLSAALVEGALTFVVKHARSLALPVFKSKDFEREPRTWKLEDLIQSAASGGDGAVLDASAKARVEELARTRQRIHAGRMLSDAPTGPSDLRPEEAVDAKATAALIVRRVLDWLERFPPTPTVS